VYKEKMGNGDESLDTAFDRVKDYEKLEKSKHFVKLAALYDNEMTRVDFRDILQAQSSERPYFLTLLNAGALDKGLPQNVDYATLDQKDMDPTDPFGLVERFTTRAPRTGAAVVDADGLGKELKKFLSDDILTQIHDKGRNATDIELGRKYNQTVQEGRLEWDTKKAEFSNNIFVQVNLYYYREMQK
jgi:hypothetical protein